MTLGELLLETREDFCVEEFASVYVTGKRLGVNLWSHLGPATNVNGIRLARVIAVERATVEELRREGKLRVSCSECLGAGRIVTVLDPARATGVMKLVGRVVERCSGCSGVGWQFCEKAAE